MYFSIFLLSFREKKEGGVCVCVYKDKTVMRLSYLHNGIFNTLEDGLCIELKWGKGLNI